MKYLLLRARVVAGTSNSSFSRLRHKFASKSESHVQHDYFSSLNQSNHWFVIVCDIFVAVAVAVAVVIS